MNYKLLRNIAVKFSSSGRRKRFMNFARVVALVSVIIGSMALIISLSVLNGFESSLKGNAIKFTSHIQLKTFKNEPIVNYKAILKKVKKEFKEIKTIVPTVEQESLISSKENVDGVMIRGFKQEYDITDMRKNIIEGSFRFSSKQSKEVVIGKRLARKLNVKIGDKVILYAIKPSLAKQFTFPEIDKYKIIGIYETGMAQYDDVYVFVPFQTAINFFKLPKNAVNLFEIMLYDVNQASEVSKKLDTAFSYPYYSITVFDIHSSIFAWIEMQKAPIPLVLGLISIVAIFNIITILLITVVEKTHSIGILRTLGMHRKEIIKIFIIQGSFIGIIGTLVGSGIGLIFGLLQQSFHLIKLKGDIYFLDSLPVQFSLWHFVVVISLSIILSILASSIPAYIASRVKPIRAINFK